MIIYMTLTPRLVKKLTVMQVLRFPALGIKQDRATQANENMNFFALGQPTAADYLMLSRIQNYIQC